jgi:hypothetical protein
MSNAPSVNLFGPTIALMAAVPPLTAIVGILWLASALVDAIVGVCA